MTYQIAILEDQEQSYLDTKSILDLWSIQSGVTTNVDWFADASSILRCQNLYTYNILISDISLAETSLHSNDENNNGITVCKKLRLLGFKGDIIFLTSFREYVFDGYDVQAFNYLLKPISKEELFKCLDKHKSIHSLDCYNLCKGSKIIKIPYDSILSISKDSHDIVFQTATEVYVERNTLNSVIKNLPPHFIQCHKSCIVNIAHIKSLNSSTIVLSNSTKQTVGRQYLSSIRAELIKLSSNRFEQR